MRRQLFIAIMLLGLLPVAGQSQAGDVSSPPLSETSYPYVIGTSVIAGMVITQAVLFGSQGFPFVASTATSAASGTAIAAEVSVGVSRMFAVTSAALGAWAANWLYDH